MSLNAKGVNMTPWIATDKYPHSAAEMFLKSLTRDGWYTGKREVGWQMKGNAPEVKEKEAMGDPSYVAAAFGKWAKCFHIGYEGETVVYEFDNGDGTEKAWLKILMDWEAWCDVWPVDWPGISAELYTATYLVNGADPADTVAPLVMFENGELVFMNWDLSERFRRTPQQFMEDITKATLGIDISNSEPHNIRA